MTPPILMLGCLLAAAAPAPGQTWESNEEKLGPFRPGGVHSTVFSTDGLHTVYVTSRGASVRLVKDGKDGPEFDDILQDTLVLSRDASRIACAVQKDNLKWRVAVNGELGPEYEKVLPASLSMSPDGAHLLYAARRAGKWLVVHDGKEDAEPLDELTAANLVLSPDGQRWGYKAKRGDKWFVGLDGKLHGPYTSVHPPVFSADNQHVAFAATSAKRHAFAVYDGKPGPTYDTIVDLAGAPRDPDRAPVNSLRMSPAGKLLYPAVGSHWFAVLDGKEGPARHELAPYLAISPDGTRAAYFERSIPAGCVYLDEQPGPPLAYLLADPVFSPDSRRCAYVGWTEWSSFGSVLFVVDGKPLPKLEHAAAPPVFSPDSRHVACAGTANGRTVLYLDGQAQNGFDQGTVINQPGFSADSRHFAAIVGDKGPPPRACFVIDGQAQPTYSGVSGGSVFQPDGTLVYFAVRDEVLFRIRARLTAQRD